MKKLKTKYWFPEYLEDPYLDFDEDEIRDRKKIFKEIMDNDGDGKVDRRELIAYLGMYENSTVKIRKIEIKDHLPNISFRSKKSSAVQGRGIQLNCTSRQ